MSNKFYDILKWIVIVVLPACATLYVLLANTWGFPYADEISATITGVTTFLGVILGVSSVKYNKAQNEISDRTEESIDDTEI